MDPLSPTSQAISDAVEKSRWLQHLLNTAVETMTDIALELAAERHPATFQQAVAVRLLRDGLRTAALEHFDTVAEHLAAEQHPAHGRLMQALETLSAVAQAMQQAPDATAPADVPAEDAPE